MAKIIGIDPGLASTGVGLVEGHGRHVGQCSYDAIRTASDLSIAGRLDIIYSKLVDALNDDQPDLLVVEDAFSYKRNPKSGLTLKTSLVVFG